MTETFDITREQAEAYEELFVPALFAQWAPLMIDIAHIEDGQRVLDVACGTGVVARAAADRVGRSGSVVGLDLNPAMLEVAAGPDVTSNGGRAMPRTCPSRTASSMPRCANLRCSSFRTLTPRLPKWRESYGPVGGRCSDVCQPRRSARLPRTGRRGAPDRCCGRPAATGHLLVSG